jgi:micrococcal nuclease
MKKKTVTSIIALLITIIGLVITQLQNPPQEISPGFVAITKVVDGDTFKVSLNGSEETVRLIGLNTPETVDPRRPVECFGKEASDKAKEILTNTTVRLEADPTQDDRDKYGRLLRYAYLPDGRLFNELMISEGYGYEYTYEVPYLHQIEFKADQKQAEELKLGLWGGQCPVKNK